MKICVVGGELSGVSTALRLRRLDEKAEIVLFSIGEELMQAKSVMTYYVGGVVSSRENLILRTNDELEDRFNIDLRLGHKLEGIDSENKEITLSVLGGEERVKETYDKLILATGARVSKDSMDYVKSWAVDNEGAEIFEVSNISEADGLKAYIEENSPKKAIVLGSTGPAIEMAENLAGLGLDVYLVNRGAKLLDGYDRDMLYILDAHLKQNGVDVVEELEGIKADFAVVTDVLSPNTDYLEGSGVDLSETSHIVVDSSFETSVKDVYALGSAVRIKYDDILRPVILASGEINREGRILADVIMGKASTYKGFLGTSIVKAFDLTCGRIGVTEDDLIEAGKVVKKDYEVLVMQPDSGDGYYPGHMPLTLKVIFDMSGLLLGAQIVGYEGVDKRIDVLATAMNFGANIRDLSNLELAYAPPYSSSNDPIHMVGFVGENTLDLEYEYCSLSELDDVDRAKAQIVDVREDIEYDMGTIDGAVNIPLNDLRKRMSELSTEKPVYLFCKTGVRGYYATRILNANGYKVYNLLDGYTAYKNKRESLEAVVEREEIKVNEGTGSAPVVSAELAPGCQRYELDACGLQCPGPILQVYKKLNDLNDGDILSVTATDPGFASDIKKWCESTGNTLIEFGKKDKRVFAEIKKGSAETPAQASGGTTLASLPNDKTIVVFSGDLDKAIAALIIANGAAAMGRNVTMFFTFWGLNVLRKNEKQNVKKDFMSKMFASMMPRGSKKLGLSKMNMFGMGPKMIRNLMKKKNVDSLETLIQTALDNGVNMIACNMSMDLMGITEEELIDGVNLGGVATYLGCAESADTNLFI